MDVNQSVSELGTRIAARLREARMRSSLRQTEVATHLGVPSNTVSTWETGTRQPRALELHRLADLYGCTSDWLLCRVDYATPLPTGELLIDYTVVEKILQAKDTAEVEQLMDWEPEMVTFWWVLRRATRVGSRQQVDSLMAELTAHVQKVAPRLWHEHVALRRALRKRRDHFREHG